MKQMPEEENNVLVKIWSYIIENKQKNKWSLKIKKRRYNLFVDCETSYLIETSLSTFLLLLKQQQINKEV
jgi:hypothetical protein